MAFHHIVFTGEDCATAQNTDAPIILGIEIFLCQHQRRLLEQGFQCSLELLLILRTQHAAGKGTIRYFNHHGEAQVLHSLLHNVFLIFRQNQRFRCRDLVVLQQIRQEHLVSAAQNRDRVINGHHALRFSLAGKSVGVMINRRGFTDKQTVVFRQPHVILAGNGLNMNTQLFAGRNEIIKRFRVARWQFFIRIHQHREIKTELAPRAWLAPECATETIKRAGKRILL